MNEGLTKRVQLLIWVHCMPKKESVSRNPSDQKTVRTAIRSKSVIYIAVKAVHYAKNTMFCPFVSFGFKFPFYFLDTNGAVI